MAVWRQHLRLAIALIAALSLHLLAGFGLNVYGIGSAPRKTSSRISVRLVKSPQPPAVAAAAAAAISPVSRRPLKHTPALTIAKSPVVLPQSIDPPAAVPAAASRPETPPPEPPVTLPEPPLPDMPTLGVIEIPDLQYYPATEVDQVAEPVAPVNVNFPFTLGRSRVNGMVVALLKIDENGLVVDADIEFSDPPGVFDNAALGPFIYARYTPAQKAGKPVRSEKRIEVIFGEYRRPQLFGPQLAPAGK